MRRQPPPGGFRPAPPSAPPHGRAPLPPSTPPAAQASIRATDLARVVKGSHRAHEDLQEACLRLLELRHVPAMPIYTGPRVRPRPGGGWDLRHNAAQRGFSDIAACLPPAGLMALLELKTGRARRSPEQVRFAARFRGAGAVTAVIRNVLDLEALLNRYAPTIRQGGSVCEF